MARMTLKLPKLAVSMREGTLVEWLVANGDRVEEGQSLYVIETEKSSSEVESPFAGVLTTLAVAGETYDVGAPIAHIDT